MKKLSIIYTILLASISASSSANFKEGADITNYLNSLIQKQNVVNVPSGSFNIDATKSIRLKNNSQLIMSPDTKLNVIPTSNGSYRVFLIKNVKNVILSGGEIVGDKHKHLGKNGEWGMGIEIRDSQNIKISNMTIQKMWGDGIYVGTSGKNSTSNIFLNNIKLDDNRRQGLSIISVDGLYANKISATNTSGTLPASGIDIEPENGDKIIKNINLDQITTKNNEGAGIQIGLSRFDNQNDSVAIKIQNHTDIGSKYGLLMGAVNKKALGKIEMASLDYSKSKIPSCFHSWSNKNLNIEITGQMDFSSNQLCKGFYQNQSFSFLK